MSEITAKKVIPIADAATEQALYEVRKKIYPRAVSGVFARWRVILVLFTQAIFYGMPWLSWDHRQAVLLDLVARKFYIFGLVLWPQDVIYLAVLLVISALSLFLFTAIAGRLFCGYACPQTVYTEIFMWIERKVEGDRFARIRLDGDPWSWTKLRLKATKHALWAIVALWTGFTFVGYFTPIRLLGAEVFALALGPWQLFWMLFYAFATWGNAGFMREQVCKYMCPYARFQSVMVDRDTYVVTFDTTRGEPRGRRSRSADARALGLGDCVDCSICVQVCPTGIDIREGLQYECIGCGACVDACDQVMDKMDYPHGLIRYTSENAMLGKLGRRDALRRVLRPRILIYIGIWLAILVAFFASLALRSPLRADVMRDRGALAREVEGEQIENVYRLQLMNASDKPLQLRLSAQGGGGLPTDGLHVVDQLGRPLQTIVLPAESNRLMAVKLRVSEHAATPGNYKIRILVRATSGDQVYTREEQTSFIIPR